MLTQEQAIKALVGQYERAKADQMARMTRVEKMRRYTLKHKAFLTSAMGAGDNAWRGIFDNMGQTAAADFAANFYTEATPGDQNWFCLMPPAAEPDLANDRDYGQTLAERTERIHQGMARTESNWATEIHSAMEDLTDGTCCMEVSPDPESRGTGNAFLFTTLAMNEFAFIADGAGRPRTVFSERAFTAAEAAERFGRNKLPAEKILALEELKDSAYVDTSAFLNIQRKRQSWDPTSLGPNRFAYDNLWVDLANKKLVQAGGQRRLRRIVARFRAGRGMPWGQGPTDSAYGPIRALDKAVEIVLKYGAMAMNPPSVWPDDGAFWPQDATPGAIIVGRMGAADKGRPEFMQLTADHRIGEFLINYLAGCIARAYMTEVFQVLRDSKQRTAREVATIVQKSYSLVIPPLARIKQELLGPVILNTLEIQTEQDLGVRGWMYGGQALPDWRYDLEMVSPLYLAMKYNELQRMDDLITLNSRLAEMRPDVWDNYSLDDMSRAIGENMGVPVRWRMSVYDRNRLRDRRNAAAEQQQAVQQAALAAQATSKLAKGPEPGSPLEMAMTEA